MEMIRENVLLDLEYRKVYKFPRDPNQAAISPGDRNVFPPRNCSMTSADQFSPHLSFRFVKIERGSNRQNPRTIAKFKLWVPPLPLTLTDKCHFLKNFPCKKMLSPAVCTNLSIDFWIIFVHLDLPSTEKVPVNTVYFTGFQSLYNI